MSTNTIGYITLYIGNDIQSMTAITYIFVERWHVQVDNNGVYVVIKKTKLMWFYVSDIKLRTIRGRKEMI